MKIPYCFDFSLIVHSAFQAWYVTCTKYFTTLFLKIACTVLYIDELRLCLGVYTKLRDPQISWEKKISIAQNAWSDEKCFIPNKHQILLDWVCQKLVDHILYKKDKKLDGEQMSREVKDLWAYFENVLQSASKPVNGKESVCVPLTLMPQLVQVSGSYGYPLKPGSYEQCKRKEKI